MAKQNIDIGIEGNDNTGDSVRESFRKVNENFTELYAVFGIGGQISFTDLSDVPNTYEDQERKIPAVKDNATGLEFLSLASDSALDPNDVDTIGFEFTEDGELVIRALSTKVSNDPFPTLGGPLNAALQPIGNVSEIDEDAADLFNSVHGTNITVDNLLIDKKFADANYQEKQRAGAGLRLDPEPSDTSEYIKTFTSFDSFGNPVITDHGLSGAFLGSAFIFTTTEPLDTPTNISDGQTVYIRPLTANVISLHFTETDALNNTGRIILSGGSGTFTLTDADYDDSLEGNWLSTVAIPRESIVRRQGDRMEGALFLHDHPGDLAGLGTSIGGTDDLQAATKLYVDKGTPTSQVNIYVSEAGDDRQTFTPAGKEGRSQSWAYRTINAAARKAEEIIEASPYEPGPYLQTMTYGDNDDTAKIVTGGITSPIAGRANSSTLILENKEFIQAEVLAFINATYPDFEYDQATCARDIGYIVDSVRLDILLGNNANYLSRWAGIRYYSNPSARKAIGEQRTETVAGIEHAKKLVRDVVKGVEVGGGTDVTGTLYQTDVEQYIEPALVAGAVIVEQTADATDAKFDIITDIIEVGPLDAPTIKDGQTTYKLNVGNGNNGFIDQGNPTNTDIIPGKVVRGKNSGAIGRIISYKYEADPDSTVGVAETDEFEVQLLEPIEFENGEELEYGNIVRETQITIFVESGIYEEDYPIRVPANVSIKGDEFRRCIIRPKRRVSQSRYANTFFYRDASFDNMTIVSSGILEIDAVENGEADASRTPGTYTNVSPTTVTEVDPITAAVTVREGTSGVGTDALFEIVVDADGRVRVTDVTITNPGTGYLVGDTITISDDDLGGGGGEDIILYVGKISGGKEYVNPLTSEIDGYFGYHYLRDPNRLKDVGPGFQNPGDRTIAAQILNDNREYIQEQVVEYIDSEYPAVVYSPTKCARDVGLIVDAMAADFVAGSNENILEAQGEYYYGALPIDGSQTEATEAGIAYIHTIASALLQGQAPATTYGINLDYPTPDLSNGEAEDGSVAMSLNFITTINYAFNENYNPPLRNDDMDAFLMNDATILRNITVQGHGGFMCVLDPYGQVLTKSPYIQTGSSFSRSLNKQVFAGGMFVDAFTGNSAVRVTEKVDGSPFELRVKSFGSQADPQGLFVRRPETPAPFYIDGRRFQVNAIKDYDPDFGTATLLLDKNSNDGAGFTGLTSTLDTGVDLDSVGEFEFDEAVCRRDTFYILEAVGYDTALGTNFNAVYNGLAYRRNSESANLVLADQLTQTVAAITVGKTLTLALTEVADSATATTRVGDAFDEIIDIIQNGEASADAIVWTDPGIDSNKRFARELLQANRDYIATEISDWVAANYPSLSFNQARCERDIKYIVDALSYDIQYGGTSATVQAARSYYDGITGESVLPEGQKAVYVATLAQLSTIVQQVLVETYAGQTLNGGNTASATEQTEADGLITIISDVIDADVSTAVPSATYPSLTWTAQEVQDARTDIVDNSQEIVLRVVQSVEAPIDITIQTAGNRSMLGNDFTQVNDQGYGLVVVNGALSEMVSMFTYYCWASYYAKNGSEIRSLTGSSCYGEYGLVAEGSDPNEIPDGIVLRDDMSQPAKAFTADVILKTTNPISLGAGDEIEQNLTGATGTVTMSINGRYVYLTNVTGSFDTTNQLILTTDSTPVNLGADSIPEEVDSSGYSNDKEQLSANLYDIKVAPSNRGEFDVYHPVTDIFARYEIANVNVLDHVVGRTTGFGDTIAFASYTGGSNIGTGVTFYVDKSVSNGYTVTSVTIGEDYEVGEQLVIAGDQLGGTTPANDITITVDAIDSNGGITEFSYSGTIFVNGDTPYYNGQVYRVNFSTGDSQFSQDGILETGGITHGTPLQVRYNQTFILGDIARPDILTIRPSTAVIFRENPNTVYRSISFLTADATGEELDFNQSLAGFDSTYDYVRLTVNPAKAQEAMSNVLDLAGDPITASVSKTKGGTIGDTTIAVARIFEENEITRLNNNVFTEEDFRPFGFTQENAVPPMIASWSGKKFIVANYRGVSIDPISGDEQIVPTPSETDDYGIVDLIDLEDSNVPNKSYDGISQPVVLGNENIILRAGLQAGSAGTVTINISTCRATGHDFLDVGTGGFNTSNYPNVIFGLPRQPDQAREVDERGEGRVFYVSTDQNGIFRVGRFFSVDQGTGTVSFSASIALSDVDGLGFKRGVVVTEFSTDTAMTDNASDTVPTESAIRGYVNRRLGFDQTGAAISNKIGPGVLAPNGSVPMTADLNAAGNTITNVSEPDSDSDVATKNYVDNSQGNNDTLPDLRDTEINDPLEGQLLVSTEHFKLIVDAGSVVGGPFEIGQTFTGSLSGAEGTVVDILETTGFEGNIIVITYEPVSGTFSSGPPIGADVIEVLGAVEATVIDGPVKEWANGVYSADSDIEITTNRVVSVDGGGAPTDRYVEVDVQIKADTIVNADVNASAGILQSKLNLQAAGTLASETSGSGTAGAIVQADLGLAVFDENNFDSVDGFISLKNNGITLGDLEQIGANTVLGNSLDVDGDIAQIAFSTVVDEGTGLLDADFDAANEIAQGSDPGQALIKTGEGTYGITEVTLTGEPNSIVKTDANGSIQINSLILGGDSNYEILSLDTTELVFKTPGQGTILTATGGSQGTGAPGDPGYVAPSYPDLEIPGNVNIGSTGVAESTLKTSSNFNGESVLAVDWIYSSFIEAPGEKGTASTGIAIGADTGKTLAGQIGIITADGGTSSSVVPFIFSSTGVVPDVDNIYNIGSASKKYNTVYATFFNGVAAEAYYADLAENYTADEEYEPGTVVVFGGEEELTLTNKKGDTRVAGIVSLNPAYLMNSHLEGEHVVALALQGRVPCKVLGRVHKGDMLVTSAIPGYAIVNNEPGVGQVIGKAVATKEDDGKGVVEVVVGRV